MLRCWLLFSTPRCLPGICLDFYLMLMLVLILFLTLKTDTWHYVDFHVNVNIDTDADVVKTKVATGVISGIFSALIAALVVGGACCFINRWCWCLPSYWLKSDVNAIAKFNRNWGEFILSEALRHRGLWARVHLRRMALRDRWLEICFNFCICSYSSLLSSF